ncbi:hypothetical protein ACFLYF_01440 [Chloroflexota bacterium]
MDIPRNVMQQDSPLKILDEEEEQVKQWLYNLFPEDLNLLERQIQVISRYSIHLREFYKHKYGSDFSLTLDELKSASDALVLDWVPALLMFHAVENLQAARLNTLHGYLSITPVCLRNVAESLHWSSAAISSVELARDWLDLKKRTKVPKSLNPVIQEMMKYFTGFSKFGAHPLPQARWISCLTKPDVRSEIGNENLKTMLKGYINTLNLFSANFLLVWEGIMPWLSNIDPILSKELNCLRGMLNHKFRRGKTGGTL